MSSERMLERFVRLCEIPSPTGSEREVTDAIAGELSEHRIRFFEDGSAERARAGSGNLIARIPGSGDPEAWVGFFAHVDTVPHSEPIEVVDDEGVYRSKGETILGADNKAAVTVVLELGAILAARPPRVGVELVFTVAEEHGLRGAAALDQSELRSRLGFVFDHATPIGGIITASPTYKKLLAEFHGVEAHAGLRPEHGRNAIEAAAAAIGAMELGRLDAETTANLGIIAGGSAPNVVAGGCRIEAEARAVQVDRVETVVAEMVDACTRAAGEHGCTVDVEVTTHFSGYRIEPSSRPLAIATAALERCGIEPTELPTGGGSDANALRLAGYDALLLANGTEANHTAAESVAAAELIRMLAVCEALVDESARDLRG